LSVTSCGAGTELPFNVPRPGPTWVGNKTQPTLDPHRSPRSAALQVALGQGQTDQPWRHERGGPDPFSSRDSQFHATHSLTASPVDQKASRWSSPSRSRMVQAGIDEADEPRWRLLPEPGYRAISGIVGGDHTGGTVVIAAASYLPLVIAEVRLSTGTASLVRTLPKRGSMNSPLHWQGGPPPWCGPPTPSRIWREEELDG
jgi:hypothetical protein